MKCKNSVFKAKNGTKDDLVSATLLITRMIDVVLATSNVAEGQLREHIGDDEMEEMVDGMGDGMPVLI